MNIPQKISTNYETFGTLLLNDRQGEKINLKVEPSLEPLAENMEGRLSINYTDYFVLLTHLQPVTGWLTSSESTVTAKPL